MNKSVIEATLKKYWGYDGFRPLQAEIIMSVLEGHDTLGLMPTGGGKSITFQVPGLIFGGLTVVVTPLISLMKDQVDNLHKKGIKAVYFHAGMSAREIRVAWEKLVNGRARFLYISPERLRNERFIDELRHLNVSLIVVDEAHCISQWGYDFRPSYLRIAVLRKAIPKAPVLALTATATPEVASDIESNLLFRSGHNRFRKSFARDNISYVVRPSETKINDVFHILNRTYGSAIVYVRSRKRTREIAEYLSNSGISATFYHAGLDFETKASRQNDWQAGGVRVMVATNAFGMGIDKPDVRVVIHYDIPPSLEEYYQEAGRAGRDGLESYAVILPSRNDKGLLHRRISETFPDRDYIKYVYEKACLFLNLAIGEGYNRVMDFDFHKFISTFKLQDRQCLAAFHILSRAGYLDFIEETEQASRIMITVEREELYYTEGLSENAEVVLDRTLRNYPGLFIDYVYISENLISRESGLTPQQVYEAYLELSRRGVVHYVPRTRTPYMYIPTSREETEHIRIGREVYENRIKVMKDRIDAMEAYIYGSDGCRVRRMLEYFGEEGATDCGKCDSCRERRKNARKVSAIDSDAQRLERISSWLSMHPEGNTVTIISHALGLRPDETGRALSFLCDNGFAECRGDLYYASSSD